VRTRNRSEHTCSDLLALVVGTGIDPVTFRFGHEVTLTPTAA